MPFPRPKMRTRGAKQQQIPRSRRLRTYPTGTLLGMNIDIKGNGSYSDVSTRIAPMKLLRKGLHTQTRHREGTVTDGAPRSEHNIGEWTPPIQCKFMIYYVKKCYTT